MKVVRTIILGKTLCRSKIVGIGGIHSGSLAIIIDIYICLPVFWKKVATEHHQDQRVGAPIQNIGYS